MNLQRVSSLRDTPRGHVDESLCSASQRVVALTASAIHQSSPRGAVATGAAYWMEQLAGKGTYCLLDEQLTAIPEPSKAATADPRDILFPEEHYLLTQEHLLLPVPDRPSTDERCRLIVNLGVKRGRYPAFLKRMHSSGMIFFAHQEEGSSRTPSSEFRRSRVSATA